MRLAQASILLFILPLCARAADDGRTFQNPIISGFYPDPSICRSGDDYYLVHSTFEYFPGVPVFHTKDLVHWRQIGHCLTRPSQVRLQKMRASGGIYAPTIRYHDGTFYMVTTTVDGGGNFYVTATDPAGPWSEPVQLDRTGIDPSLFFDDDGTVYYTRHVGAADGYIGQTTLDLKTGKLAGELKEIWRGTGGVWPEGPHLYKVGGRYYLMIAEGGTSYGHKVTVARSDSPWGPFEPCPNNPILTHEHRPDHAVQALGHPDMVETPDGWWMVCLGIRPQGGKFHHIGRETFLAPVQWVDGWPVVNQRRGLELTMPAPQLTKHPWPAPASRDEFDSAELGLDWNFLRIPRDADWSLSTKPGFLRLQGSAVTLTDKDSPAFVGRRQTALACKAATKLSFEPTADNEEAGLVLRGNDKHHAEIGLTQRDGKRTAFFRQVQDAKTVEPVRCRDVPEGDVVLSVEAKPLSYELFVTPTDGKPISLGTVKTQDLSTEKVGGFTGVYFGLYATGNGRANSVPADFDWFDYTIESR